MKNTSENQTTPEEIAESLESIAASLKRSHPKYHQQLLQLAAQTREKQWQLAAVANVVRKITELRKASLQRARQPEQSPVERAYLMAEANTYNITLDILAEEFGTEIVWKMVE